MPIAANQLKAGYVLFKHASSGMISQKIKKGQQSHYKKTVQQTGMHSPMKMSGACSVTHVAIAAGVDDVLEFDEGGASKWQIVMGSGHGFVRGRMSLPSRAGNRYEVFECTNHDLALAAADKADFMWDLTHQGNTKASYGLNKVLHTSLRHKHGKKWTQESFREQLSEWLDDAHSSGFFGLGSGLHIKMFCSEFAMFCYLWAAAELSGDRFNSLTALLGTDHSRISPAELYTRMDTVGKANFQFKGTLYTSRAHAA